MWRYKVAALLHRQVRMPQDQVNMFVLLINFSCPKLSYVPAVFPTKSHSYPDPSVPSYAPLPSSASGSIMGPVEMRLTRTCSRHVVAKGYLSWLCDTVRKRLQLGKISVGLRLIEFGVPKQLTYPEFFDKLYIVICKPGIHLQIFRSTILS